MSNLTGNIRFRTNWRGKLILQVEYRAPDYSDPSMGSIPESMRTTRWRDATVKDATSSGNNLQPIPNMIYEKE